MQPTAQFNFVTGGGGKSVIIAELLKTPLFNERKVVIVSSNKPLAEQNERFFTNRIKSVTAYEVVRSKYVPEEGELLIIDELPNMQLRLLTRAIRNMPIEVWTINQPKLRP